ncbi:LAMI_0F12332g1_1 [Lachancea mirantina]|uniref:LAMI_0F12332g1_1 n=1 Tax=Lachancea mirantina TaxID=1230905 RepID=A0A1G4K2W4_9SACH|nr:LAMI_0F12332g1_1 [Lachancea mirantina]
MGLERDPHTAPSAATSSRRSELVAKRRQLRDRCLELEIALEVAKNGSGDREADAGAGFAPDEPLRPVRIDGATPLAVELEHKIDPLPLLNARERAERLKWFLPNVRVLHAHTHNGRTVASLEFGTTDAFQLDFELCAAPLELRVTHLSTPVRLALGPLVTSSVACGNVARLLLGCYEFQRLCGRRHRILRALQRAFAAWGAALSGPARLSVAAARGTVCIRYELRFPPGSALPISEITVSVHVTAKVVGNLQGIAQAQGIADALMREYGVEHGLEAFVRAVITA